MLLALCSAPAIASAQDATPAAECLPGEMSQAPADATPTGDLASPEAESERVGIPADEKTTATAMEFMANLQACVGNPEALATLVTNNAIEELSFGSFTSVQDALADGFFEEITLDNLQINGVNSYEDGSIGVELQHMEGQYQLVGAEWILVQENGAWKVDGQETARVEPDGDAAAVGVNLNEIEGGYEIVPNTASVVAAEVSILQAINPETNAEPHELVIFQVPEGQDPAGVLDGTIPEEDINLIGFVVVPEPGQIADLVLLDLPPGVYALGCFVQREDGEFHANHGMLTTFEVTAAAE